MALGSHRNRNYFACVCDDSLTGLRAQNWSTTLGHVCLPCINFLNDILEEISMSHSHVIKSPKHLSEYDVGKNPKQKIVLSC